VLLALADSVNEKKDNGICWPSVATLSKKTCLSRRAVQYAINRLSSGGYLSKQERHGRSHVFTVTHADGAPVHAVHPAQDAPPPMHTVRPTRAHGAPRIRRESEIEPEGRGTRLPEDFSLNPERKRFCKKEGLDPERTFETFCDYWRAANGANAIKRDWNAAWRIWCRKEKEFRKRDKPNLPDHSAEWLEAKSLAQAIGFRDPWPQESVGAYMTDIKLEMNQPAAGKVLDFKNVLKRVPL